jgi:hypothetical protein
MPGSVRRPFPSLAIEVNQPGSFVRWSIFGISVANLVLIAVMVVMFGVALLPFPRGRREEAATVTGSETDGGTAAASDPADDGNSPARPIRISADTGRIALTGPARTGSLALTGRGEVDSMSGQSARPGSPARAGRRHARCGRDH